jgi:hypothetical protein
MRVVPEQEQLVPPFLCHICETSPQREAGIDVIDTGWNFDPPALTPLNGRKLVCGRCVAEMANLLGFRTSDEVDRAKKALEDARRFLQPIQGQVASLAQDISTRMDKLYNLPSIDGTETSQVVKDRREKEEEDK